MDILIKHVPWDEIKKHEKQAWQNHGQTVERLAQRGGLSCCEAVAVFEDRRWHAMPTRQARAKLMLLAGHYGTHGQPEAPAPNVP